MGGPKLNRNLKGRRDARPGAPRPPLTINFVSMGPDSVAMGILNPRIGHGATVPLIEQRGLNLGMNLESAQGLHTALGAAIEACLQKRIAAAKAADTAAEVAEGQAGNA